MPEVDTGPELKADDMISFLDSRRPSLPDGVYKVTVTHDLAVNGKAEMAATRSLEFVVAGPRFVLAPDEIVSCFPPPGAQGAFGSVLPHVVLRRPTLPWERSAVPGAKGDGPPWLALLEFEEGEILKSETVPASQLLSAIPPAPAPPFALLPQGLGDDPKQQVLVIEISAATARNVLPTVSELSLLAGVREVNGTDRAQIVANRIPASDLKAKHVHLVSLEDQYPPPKQEHWAAQVATGNIRLVSLAQWDFYCAPGGDLGALLNDISIREIRLDPAGLGATFGPVQAGAIPLEYRLEDGERTAAWYHGPLTVQDHGAVFDLPARTSGELLLVEQSTGMADVSYAAAWELGRLIALRNPSVGVPLNQWKRQSAHANHATQWVNTAPEVAQGVVPAFSLIFPFRDWFDTALARLAAVPFSYLVPEPDLLPMESVCLFTLDSAWIAALFDGAFSIGRNSARQCAADKELRVVLPPIVPCSGVLMRSAAVAGWPDLLVDALDTGGKGLDRLRFARLADDTLLVLFNGALASVEVYPHPQALHFGFDGDAQAGFTKEGKAVKFRGLAVNIDALKADLGATGSHDFTPRMIEGAPKVSYQIKTTEATHV